MFPKGRVVELVLALLVLLKKFPAGGLLVVLPAVLAGVIDGALVVLSVNRLPAPVLVGPLLANRAPVPALPVVLPTAGVLFKILTPPVVAVVVVAAFPVVLVWPKMLLPAG